MEKEPPIFKAFIQVFEAEKNLSESGTKHLADSLGFLTVEIKSIDWEVSAQVAPIVFKMACRLLSKSLDIQGCTVHDAKLATCTLQVIVDIMSSLKGRAIQNDRKLVHSLAVSTIFTSNRESINRLLFLITATLEACKSTAHHRADHEHIASLALSFLKYFFSVWRRDVGAVGWQGNGDATRQPLPALTGPYLAQSIQCCLFLSQHRAKDLALVSLQVLSLMIQSLLLQDEPSSPSDRDILLGAVATWRTFLPGIFGNLFAGCRSSGVQRGTPVLVTYLETLLNVTLAVTADALYSHLFPPPQLDCSPEAFQTLLMSASATFNSSQAGASHFSLGPTVPVLEESESQVQGLESVIGDVPITPASLQWRVDTAQRLVQHIPVAYRKVWGEVSNTAVSSKCRLVDALCSVLRKCSMFLGTKGVVELSLLLLECTRDEHPQVATHSYQRAKELRAAWSDAVWSDVQSLFIQRFCGSVWELGRLTSSSSGGKEVEVQAEVTAALGCLALLSRKAVSRCMTVLLSSYKQDSTDEKESSKWDALRCLQRLLVCEVSESGAALGGGFSGGFVSRLCILHSRRYYSHDKACYADAGYFRAPFVHLRSQGVETSLRSSSGRDSLEERSGGRPRGCIGLVMDLAGVLGSCDVSLDGLVALWCDAVDKAERAGNRRARRHKKRVHKTRPAKTDSHTQSLRMATAATTLLGYALTVADRPPEKKSGETVTGSTAQPTNVEGTLECAHCGATGKFRSKDQNVPGRSMLRCSRCKKTYYCSADHQAKHWSTHKISCNSSPRQNSESPAIPLASSAPIPDTSSADENSSVSVVMVNSSVHVACVRRVSSQVLTTLTRLLHFFLSTENGWVASRDADVASMRSTELFISAVLDLLGNVFTTCPDIGKASLMQILVPLLCVAMQQDILHSSSPLGGVGAGTGIIRQAALTTLVRIALALNYKSGRQFLRDNLDYIVDDVCSSLRRVRRLSVHLKRTSSDSQLRETVPGIGGIYDDKIIRVVGAVFAELDDVSAEGGLGGDAIEMVLRDLVSEALEAVDTLCAMAISSSHTSSSVSTASALVTGQAGRTTSDVHRHDQQLLAPLLGLMHSLVQRAVPPLATLIDPIAQSQSLLRRQGLFPFPIRPVDPTGSHTTSTSTTTTTTKSSADTSVGTATSPAIPNGSASSEPRSGAEAVMSEALTQQENLDAEAALAQDADEDEAQTTVSRGIEMVRNILDRCCYFLTVPDVSLQVMVMSTISAAFTRLAHNRRILLPAAHRVWPVLMNRLREQRLLFVRTLENQMPSGKGASHDIGVGLGRSAYLLHHLLEFMSLLAYLCGDFVNMKFKDDLWKELLPILHVISLQSLSELVTREHQENKLLAHKHRPAKVVSGTQLDALGPLSLVLPTKSPHALDEKVKVSLLRCLRRLATTDFTMYLGDPFAQPVAAHTSTADQRRIANPLTVVAPVCAFLTLPLLGRCEGPHIHEEVKATYFSLCELDPTLFRLLACLRPQHVDGGVSSSSSSGGMTEGVIVDPVKEWQSFASNSVIVDSFNHFSNLLSKSQNMYRLSRSSVGTGVSGPKKSFPLSAIHSLVIPSFTSHAESSAMPPNSDLDGGSNGGMLLRERSTVMKQRRGPNGEEVSSSSKCTIVPQHEQMFRCFTSDQTLLQHVESILAYVERDQMNTCHTTE